ncbi:MAG: RHS repeat-associated core domain-containing protein [Paucimonas sp.]|jgi:RHS repeat-associated protein|nr:RHS repeat-associated core domain-containing protein [Paucimonas sp.]
MDTPDDVVQQQRLPAGRQGFNGELPEPVTGHYLLGNGYRAYSPVLMIFLQPDSWSPFGAGGINAYAYCEGDTVNAVDPTGHVPMLGRINFNNRLKAPAFSPSNSRPSSPFTASAQASRYLADFVKEPTPTPPLVAVTSQRALAPASPLRSRSRLPKPSRQASASRSASASSGAHTRPPRPATTASDRRSARDKRNNRITIELPRMIAARDTPGIVELYNQPLSKSEVVRQLRYHLPFTDQERSGIWGNVRQHDLKSLATRVRSEGDFANAEFYETLYPLVTT